MSDIVAASGLSLQPSFHPFSNTDKFSTIFLLLTSLRKNVVEITVTQNVSSQSHSLPSYSICRVKSLQFSKTLTFPWPWRIFSLTISWPLAILLSSFTFASLKTSHEDFGSIEYNAQTARKFRMFQTFVKPVRLSPRPSRSFCFVEVTEMNGQVTWNWLTAWSMES